MPACRRNAFNKQAYDELIDALNWASNEPAVSVTVLTGAGDYYSSGNDLSNFSSSAMSAGDGPEAMSQEAGKQLTRFVMAFVNFSKPLIAAVNGKPPPMQLCTINVYPRSQHKPRGLLNRTCHWCRVNDAGSL